MANPFYTPSGNPTTGSEGLSALMRGEFISIGAAFDLMPRISTTGLFDTIFTQTGSYTFTLPSGNGTLATTANIGTETSRAQAAEGVLTTAISAETAARAAAVSAETARAQAAEALLAPIASPSLTGVPLAPTAAPGTNTTQIATTAFSAAAIAVEAAARASAEALLAPKASPALTGTPTAPTASPGTNTTQVATTAFSAAAVLVETTRAQAAEALLAPKASPALTGVPTAPTASPGTNTTQVATTAFTTAAISAAPAQFSTISNVSASRALSTTYTNSTGRVMFVSIELVVPGSGAPSPVDISIFLNGQQFYYMACNVSVGLAAYAASGTFMVPPLATYKATSVVASPTIVWLEIS